MSAQNIDTPHLLYEVVQLTRLKKNFPTQKLILSTYFYSSFSLGRQRHTSPMRPIAWESEDIMQMAPISCKMSSAAMVSQRIRDSANATSSGMSLLRWWQTICQFNKNHATNLYDVVNNYIYGLTNIYNHAQVRGKMLMRGWEAVISSDRSEIDSWDYKNNIYWGIWLSTCASLFLISAVISDSKGWDGSLSSSH